MTNQKTSKRQLSAVLFADIQGYTAMMQSDEQNGMVLLRKYQKVLQKEVEKNNGQIVKNYGDGSLCIFPTALSAVTCAKALQENMRTNPIVPLRIGLHEGDVIWSDDDVYGDTINLTSRIESCGIAGNVLMSKSFYQKVRNNTNFEFKLVGEISFKNVKDPIEIHALANPPFVVPKRRQLGGKLQPHSNKWKNVLFAIAATWLALQLVSYSIQQSNLDQGVLDLLIIIGFFGLTGLTIYFFFKPLLSWRSILFHSLNILSLIAVLISFMLNPVRLEPSKFKLFNLLSLTDKSFTEFENSIAILPFSNFTGDESLQYLHDGLIHEVNKIRSIRTTSRTSSMPYANSEKMVKQIGKELDVDAIMETSLNTIDTGLQLRVNLVDVFPVEKTLWSESYNTSLDDIPELFTQITLEIVSHLNVDLLPEEEKLLGQNYKPNPGAYEAYLKGQYYAGFLTPEAIETANTFFLQSIEIDPGFALGYGGLCLVWVTKKQMGYISTLQAVPKIKNYLSQSVRLDSMNSENWLGQASVLAWTDFKWKESENAFLKSIELNPNAAIARASYSHLLTILNRFQEAKEQIAYAEKLDPLNPWVLSFSGALHVSHGKLITAAKKFEKLKKLEPDHPMLTHYLFAKYSLSFQNNKAIEQLKKLIYLSKGHEIFDLIDRTFQETDFKNTLNVTAQALEKLNETQFLAPTTILQIYEAVGNDEKKIYWMNKLLEIKDGNLPYYGIRNKNPIQKNPEYIRIMEEIGLW